MFCDPNWIGVQQRRYSSCLYLQLHSFCKIAKWITGFQTKKGRSTRSHLSTTMDETVKIEKSEVEMVGEELDVKTEMKTSTSHIEPVIKSEIDTDGNIERLNHEQTINENQDCNDFPIISNDFIKIENVKDEPEYYVKDAVCYIDTIQLNEELNIKNGICADPDSSSLECKRIKTEDDTGKWNDSVLSLANIVVKADPDASTLHTEFDAKSDSNPSTSAVSTTSVMKTQITRKDQQVVADEETAGDTFVCYHCEYAARSKRHLIDHLKVHNNGRYIYSCYYCDFRTNSRIVFATHIRTHSSDSPQFEAIYIKEENVDDNFGQGDTMLDSETNVLNRSSSKACIHCNATFRQKIFLNDHIIRKHPEFISSVSSKIHDCTQCTYKTTFAPNIKTHLMIKHPETAGNHLYSRCIYCCTTFTTKLSRDDHIVKIHPDFITTISRKVYNCIMCTYKTVIPSQLKKHIKVKHSEIAGSACIYCYKIFKCKETLDDHILKRHPDFVRSVSSKVRECTKCNYKTNNSTRFKRHMVKHSVIADSLMTSRCNYCNKAFKCKGSLDDHIVNRHPDFIASVSKQVHNCTKCSYKTVNTGRLKQHMVQHPDIAGNRKTSRCNYCSKTFVHKQTLDDHIVKIHPDFIASVSSKVHECTKCIYKTTNSNLLKQHIKVKHPEIAGNRIGSRCMYCNKTFEREETLDDHILKIHPDFIASVSRKVHECSECTYKTTKSSNLKKHVMVNHPTTTRCNYCSETFVRKQTLDDHIVKRHPDFIASVTSKIHECTKCTYKTTNTSQLKKHIKVKHPEIADDGICSKCIYCNKTFKCKQTLDDHILKIHPDFIASVGRSVHECSECTYKTIYPSRLKKHAMINHPNIAGKRIRTRCSYCSKTFFYKQSLDDHIVKQHPDFIASVSSKVHECTKCSYKTTNSRQFKQHMVIHHDNQNID